MKILITGGAGFIGSHLAIRLLKSGKQPILLDFLDRGESNPRKLFQLEQVNRAGSAPYYECDLLDRERLMNIIKMEKPDAIVHLGALAGVIPSLQNPSVYIDTNIQGTNHIMTCAGEQQVKHVIFASSSSVYGEQFDRPLSEDMVTGRVLSPYAASKMGAESLCHAYQHMYGFQMNILRFFTVYGPWGRPDMAFSTFIRRVMNNQSLSIFGKGTGRDYTYIDDIVTGIILTIGSSASEVYNLGSGRPVPMTEVIDQLRLHFPNLVLDYKKARKGDVKSTWADLSKAKSKIGYEPSISFKEGFENTVAWAKEHPDII
ncbi:MULTISPECIES: NAD-dependent epimerase/dehydratase family protein [Bacillaceae]|uniref:NAD-dependent epimerase/dehydratase family protein n=1 Tax=Bacillaceae TaxID=186817 RepID=UPI000C788F07|nr:MULTISPECIES: NAD-dependent epimerase/dehydratase family protein [Bacillaceae]PLR66399.1 UDP-glucose 4-epimerase [Bacillus sp. UMB0893]